MLRTSLSSNNNTDNLNKEYKVCAGKDCKNHGIKPLKIIYIHKIGWFCDSCAHGLIKLELVERND